jgi:stage II sporulation protein D
MTVRLQTPQILRAASALVAALLVSAALLATPTTARATDSIFAVTGRGWGHGIGMTQYGAKGYAEKGWDYRRILAWYFQQTTIATRAELTVKVDLDASKTARSSWWIAGASSSTTMTVSDLATGRAVNVTRGASAWITFSGGGSVLRADKIDSKTKLHVAGSVVATFTGAVVASTGSSASSKVRFLGTSGPFSQSNIAWRGQIRFTPNTTTGHAIDYVPMEQYLRGVVPRESPSSWPVEALRAQAVAARSYAYGAASSGDTLWCTTSSQVYNGADDGPNIHESTKTDSAVSATANQVVVYGSSVVQTFFSSSSGGRTANIEDVWFGSTPKPYYTSVVDADNAGPDYRWSLADMSGSTLAGKIRTHYSSSAQASPATVVKVTLEVAASGFVRNVTLDWSKGPHTTVTGPQFQHALGLKSSAFSVKLKNPPAVATTITLQSSIATVSAGAAFTLSGKVGPVRTATVTVQRRAPGTTAWVTDKTLTTKSDGTFSYSATAGGVGASAYRAVSTATTAWLSSTSAVASVEVLKAPPAPVWKRYEQNASPVKYTGSWTTSKLAGLSGGSHAFSHQTAATVTFKFTGTRARWIGKRASNYGKAFVSVDGGAWTSVDLYSPKTLNQQRLFESVLVSQGTHTLTVRVAGTKNAKSSYHYVDADAFEALQASK